MNIVLVTIDALVDFTAHVGVRGVCTSAVTTHGAPGQGSRSVGQQGLNLGGDGGGRLGIGFSVVQLL